MHPPKKKGSTLGCVLMITGCCIGAGMLGMPVITAKAGFLPSAVMMFFCCLFMNFTGQLLLESTLKFNEKVNLLSLVHKAFGFPGQILTWICYVFLFYCLSIAYTIGCGELLKPFFPPVVGYLISLSIIGVLIYKGTRHVDHLNRGLMTGLIVSYFALIIMGSFYIEKENLIRMDWVSAVPAIPLLLISFGYQNLVPSITDYLHRDAARVKKAILYGTLLTFVIYLFWEIIILGILPSNIHESMNEIIDKGQMVTQLLQNTTGVEYIIQLANTFAFFAITTSLLTNSLTCLDFFEDGCRHFLGKSHRIYLTLIVLIPPFLIALADPTLFLRALNIAGGTATVILFGIMPSLIVWQNRYNSTEPSTPILPGGKLSLIVILIISVTVLTLEIARQIT